MEELILKQYDSEVKTVEGERALNVTITTNDVDRSGDIVEPKGAKLVNFRKNPVVLMAHNYQGLPIGKASNLEKTDKGITAKVTFPEEGVYPLADTIFNMYKQKFMKAWSIGFIPIKSEDIVDEDDEDEKKMGRGRRFKTWELLEFSACSVPSNPNALSNMVSKGINVDPLKEAGFIEIVEEEKAKYNCECIKCKYKMTSDKHCKDLKCLKCGGTMRRVERPGPGEESILNNEDLIKEVCPKCGADIADDDNPEFSSCSKCDWDDSDFEKGEETDQVMVKNIVTKPEETDDFIRIPAKGEEGKHKGHKIRWIDVDTKKGIRGIYCIDCKKIITFVFDKKKDWTMAKAKKWMEDHGKMICDYFEKIDWDVNYTEEEIDWDEVKASIEKEEKEGWKLDDIYEIVKENKELKEKLKDIELKAGAVLNAKNKKNLKDAQALIQLVLDSAGEEDSLEIENEKDIKDDDTEIDLEDDENDDEQKDEKKDEDKIEIDEKAISEAITKQMNYIIGKLSK